MANETIDNVPDAPGDAEWRVLNGIFEGADQRPPIRAALDGIIGARCAEEGANVQIVTKMILIEMLHEALDIPPEIFA
jgi:hypothetical protein